MDGEGTGRKGRVKLNKPEARRLQKLNLVIYAGASAIKVMCKIARFPGSKIAQLKASVIPRSYGYKNAQVRFR
jgi:hypothetical protein